MIYGRDEAEAIASRRASSNEETQGGNSSDPPGTSHPASKHVVVGFVGYPNVGKSSTINALVGEKRTGVTSTLGKAKHFQTLIISDDPILCDCPGLVFPSFSSSRHEMVAAGVLPIDRLTEHREAVQVVANRVPRHVFESLYNITLPKPKPYELQSRPPWASELLRAYCSSRGHVSSSGLPDETRAARHILEDYIDGKLPHFELLPGTTDDDMEANATKGLAGPSCLEGNEFDSYDTDDQASSNSDGGDTGNPNLKHVLDNLESFDLVDGLPSKTAAAIKEENRSYNA